MWRRVLFVASLWPLAGGCTARLEAPASSLTIMDVQGDGLRSPLEREAVRLAGVVTAVRADGRGFWIQDPTGDGNPETSDGVLIWDRSEVEPGEMVRVSGTVAEFVGRDGDRSLTEILELSALEILSRNNALPEPVALSPLPDVSIEDAIRYWSRLEGMRVSLKRARVVGPTNRFGELVVVMGTGDLPDPHVYVRPLAGGRVDYNPERIFLDDTIAPTPDARAGDAVHDIVGVVDYSFGNYKLQLLSLDHQRGARVVAGPRQLGGVAIASFNVENLLRGEKNLDRKIDALSAFIEEPLLLPEILVLQEVEDEGVVSRLGARVNDRASTRYVAKAMGGSDGRGIENAFLYDRDRVSLLDAHLLSGPLIERAFGSSSPSPGREPLAGRFSVGGIELVVIGNHFKSKGGDDPLFGAVQPPKRRTEVQRKAQAKALRAYVDELLQDDADARILVAGDFNDFPFAEPGEGPTHPLGILEAHGPHRLENLISRLDSPYTYIFEGNAQVLDHILVSPGAEALVEGFEIVHGNADEPAAPSDHDPPVVRLRVP